MERYKICILLLTYVNLGLCMGSNVTDVQAGDITFLADELLEQLCPLVDICDANATSAELSPNGKLDENKVSCCRGCSCHADCKERQNCCYSNDKETDPSIEQSTPRYECKDSSIVHPDSYIPAEILSLQTVVNAPQGGCVVDKPLKILPGLSVHPSCDVTSYFPVYSEINDEIYKNIQCAHCHGVKDPRLLIPNYSCRNKGRTTTSLSEQFYYFETGQISPRCRIVFEYDKQELLMPKRCYRNPIGTCQSDTLTLPPVRNHPDFNIDTISKLCEKSVYAPYTDLKNIYKNVFCAMCDQSSYLSRRLVCDADTTGRFDSGGFTHLIDQRVLLGQNDRTTEDDYPVACLYNKNGQIRESCRRLYCPTGRTFSINSECTFISKFWKTLSAFQVSVKLTPVKGQDLRSKISEMETNALREALLEMKPWNDGWTIVSVLIRNDTSLCDDRGNLMVRMAAEASNPENFIKHIERSIKAYWEIEIGGRRVTFKQSFVEYNLKRKKYPSPYKIPAPSIYQADLDIYGCDEIIWEEKYVTVLRLMPVKIKKLVLCRQVQLKPQEFVIDVNKVYVSGNLTKRMLFMNEFELITTDDGDEARICLHDTFLALPAKGTGNISGPVDVLVLTVLLLMAVNTIF